MHGAFSAVLLVLLGVAAMTGLRYAEAIANADPYPYADADPDPYAYAADGYLGGRKLCEWVGRSPFCFGDCPHGTKRIASYKSAPTAVHGFKGILPRFGRSCLSGEKRLCCGLF